MKDIKSKEDIILLVDAFYKKALIDSKVGYFFTEVVPLNFAEHMPRRYNFWESILLGKATFKGNPILKHLELHSKSPLTPAHFERWFQLCKQTTESLFEGTNATKAFNSANQIGQLMQFKIARH